MVAKILEQPTLVRNRNWQPVHVATVERALVLSKFVSEAYWNVTLRE